MKATEVSDLKDLLTSLEQESQMNPSALYVANNVRAFLDKVSIDVDATEAAARAQVWREKSARLRATRPMGRDGQQDVYEANRYADVIDSIVNDLSPTTATTKDV